MEYLRTYPPSIDLNEGLKLLRWSIYLTDIVVDHSSQYKYSGNYTKSRALIGSLSSDYQPIITSRNKMAASCWRAFDEINNFRVLQCFFFSFLE